MTNSVDFDETFSKLRALLEPYAGKLSLVHDTDSNYYLDTHHIINKRPMFFGAVRKGKAYVSFHLMPVYVFPELLRELSPELKRRMQGKSCFNFKTSDEKLLNELAKLTKASFAKFKSAKYF